MVLGKLCFPWTIGENGARNSSSCVGFIDCLWVLSKGAGNTWMSAFFPLKRLVVVLVVVGGVFL